ncbi:MAG: hypothetical protein ABW321_03550 [Polyangiales bacterium]
MPACGARRLVALLLMLTALLRPQLTAAQVSDDAARSATARAFFEEGVQFAESGHWAEAEDRFRRALALRASPVLAYNLASALATRGKLVEASELLRRVQSDDTAQPGLKQTASALFTDVMQQIARLEVAVAVRQPSDLVLLDERPLLEAQLDVEIPIDPGSHQLQLQRAGRVADQQTLQLAVGERRKVLLKASLAPEAVAAVAPVVAAPVVLEPASNDDEADGGILSRWWFWTGAAVLVVAGVTVGVAAASGGTQPEPAFSGNLPPGSLRVEGQP